MKKLKSLILVLFLLGGWGGPAIAITTTYDGNGNWTSSTNFDKTSYNYKGTVSTGNYELFKDLSDEPMDGIGKDTDAIDKDVKDGLVTVAVSAFPVPEPATIFLMGLGLVLIGSSARKLKL